MQNANFFHEMRVRWAETDPQGVVFNGNYLLYFDVAVTEYFRSLDFEYPDGFSNHGIDFFVRRALVEYHSPAAFDELLKIYVKPGVPGNSSLPIFCEIYRQETHIASGEITYVCFDPATRRSTTIPDAVRQKFS